MYHTDTLYDVKLKFGNPVKNKIQSVTTHILNKFKQDSIVIEYLPNGDEASRTVYYYGSNHKLQKSVRSSKMVFGFGVSVDGIDNDTIVTSYSYKYDDNQKVVESLAKELSIHCYYGPDTTDLNNSSYEWRHTRDTLSTCSTTKFKYTLDQNITFLNSDTYDLVYVDDNDNRLHLATSNYYVDYEYNDFGLVEKAIYHYKGESGTIITSYTYRYDKKNNPIQIVGKGEEEPKSNSLTSENFQIIVREYMYK